MILYIHIDVNNQRPIVSLTSTVTEGPLLKQVNNMVDPTVSGNGHNDSKPIRSTSPPSSLLSSAAAASGGLMNIPAPYDWQSHKNDVGPLHLSSSHGPEPCSFGILLRYFAQEYGVPSWYCPSDLELKEYMDHISTLNTGQKSHIINRCQYPVISYDESFSMWSIQQFEPQQVKMLFAGIGAIWRMIGDKPNNIINRYGRHDPLLDRALRCLSTAYRVI